MKSHFVCAVIWRTNPDSGEIEFLVHDSRSTDPKVGRISEIQTKFPGGCNRVQDEPVYVTLQREILEETYLACLTVNSKEIWKREVNAEHTKYGFLVSYDTDCRGALRNEPLSDNGDDMSVPYWAPISSLKFKLFAGHQQVLLAAMENLGLL